MDTVERFLSGEKDEEWIHLVMNPEDKPQYLQEHDQRISETYLNLNYKNKYTR